MTNARFDFSRRWFAEGGISWRRDTIKAMLVDLSVDAPNVLTDRFFSDIAAGARKGNLGGSADADMPILTGKTTDIPANGSIDADDVVFLTVPVGPALEAFVVYKSVPAVSGTGDSVSAPVSGIQTVNDAANPFTGALERGIFLVSGAVNSTNNGPFLITRFVSTSQIEIYNPDGVFETSGFTWSTEGVLLFYFDTATGLPTTPEGSDITVAIDNGAARIARL